MPTHDKFRHVLTSKLKKMMPKLLQDAIDTDLPEHEKNQLYYEARGELMRRKQRRRKRR